MNPFAAGITASAVLFGFLFAGFWWSLNREIGFSEEDRHFKPAYALLLLSMIFVGYYGLAAPLKVAAETTPALRLPYRGVSLGLIAVVGYMLTEYGHYSIFQRPRYTRRLEWLFFAATAVALAAFMLFA